MTIDFYSPMGRWEAQTPAEDAWSTFVAVENGARELTDEEVDIMKELAIEEIVQM